MANIREETTIAELREAALRRSRRKTALRDPTNRVYEAANKLQSSVKQKGLEPYVLALLLGEIMNSALETAVTLGLDPAGCMTLALATEKVYDNKSEKNVVCQV